MKFGDWLGAMRDLKFWTQPDLARESGVSLSTIQKAESHETLQVGASTFTKIAKAFGKSPEEFRQAWLDTAGRSILVLYVPNDLMTALSRAVGEGMSVEDVAVSAMERTLAEAVPVVIDDRAPGRRRTHNDRKHRKQRPVVPPVMPKHTR